MVFTGHSGLAAGEAAMSSGNFDFVVASSSVSDIYAASNPTVRSYPIMASALAPSYSLPASVGTAKLKLTTVALCKMQRGAILYWSDPFALCFFFQTAGMVLSSSDVARAYHSLLSCIAFWFAVGRNDTEIKATNPSLVLPYVPVTWSVACEARLPFA